MCIPVLTNALGILPQNSIGPASVPHSYRWIYQGYCCGDFRRSSYWL